MRLNECSCGCGGSSDNCMEKPDNYMFFGNLSNIKRMVESLLKMDPEMIDSILSDGHDWASDHIASSLDDIQEVFNFLMSMQHRGMSEPFMGMNKMSDPFREKIVKTFESYTAEKKKPKATKKPVKKKRIDQDGDGDNDFADAKIAQYKAGGISKARAMQLAKKYNLK